MENETTFDAARVAESARLRLTPEETARMNAELRGMMEWLFGTLRKVDTAGVAPTIYGHSPAGVFRGDAQKPSLDREAVLRQAPERLGDEFKVPRIVE